MAAGMLAMVLLIIPLLPRWMRITLTLCIAALTIWVHSVMHRFYKNYRGLCKRITELRAQRLRESRRYNNDGAENPEYKKRR